MNSTVTDMHRKAGSNIMGTATIFDFDGLLCDGLAECMLVTWNGAHGAPVEHFSDAKLQTIPTGFRENFVKIRAYARHIGHFMVALSAEASELRSQAEFDALYDRLPEREVESFCARVNEYRQSVQTQLPELWLEQQSLYPGVRALLTSMTGTFYVATAKDAISVRRILAHHGVALDPTRIYGECRSKVEVFDRIASRERVDRDQVWFFDDNVFNVSDANKRGYRAVWADWGFHAPDHLAFAERAALRRMSLKQFVDGRWEA